MKKEFTPSQIIQMNDVRIVKDLIKRHISDIEVLELLTDWLVEYTYGKR